MTALTPLVMVFVILIVAVLFILVLNYLMNSPEIDPRVRAIFSIVIVFVALILILKQLGLF